MDARVASIFASSGYSKEIYNLSCTCKEFSKDIDILRGMSQNTKNNILNTRVLKNDIDGTIDILNAGADPNNTATKFVGKPPFVGYIRAKDSILFLAIRNVYISDVILNALIEHGANIYFECNTGQVNVIQTAIVSGNIPALKLLLNKGVSPNYVSKSEQGWSLLHHIAVVEYEVTTKTILEMEDILLKAGADPSLRAKSGKTYHEYKEHRLLIAKSFGL